MDDLHPKNMLAPKQRESTCEEFLDCRDAAVALLDQGEVLLGIVTDDLYGAHLAVAAGASIGGHYRHCLDHYACLLRGIDRGVIDYDDRGRDTLVECDLSVALRSTHELRASILQLGDAGHDGSVIVRCKIDYRHEATQEVGSTLSRELMYVVAHGVHHFALIAMMARVQNLVLPPDFGVAPSTLQHRRQTLGRTTSAA